MPDPKFDHQWVWVSQLMTMLEFLLSSLGYLKHMQLGTGSMVIVTEEP